MYIILDKVGAIQKAINIVLSKNRHVFLAQDIKILEECCDELEKLKEEVIKNGKIDDKSMAQFVRIIKLLDIFFACADNIHDFFKDLN